MKRVWSRVLRWVLFVFFSTYTILLVATSLPYGYARLPKIPMVHEEKIVQVNPTIYAGTFPDEAMLKRLKKAGVTRVVSLLDSRIPFVKDFANYEKQLCQKMGFEYINYGNFSSRNMADFAAFLEMVKGHDTRAFIHAFFDSEALRFVEKVLRSREGQSR